MERPAPLLRCEVVGQTSVCIGDVRLAFEGDLVFALALYLGLNAGEEMPRDNVAHMLWPSHDAEAARHCLRQLIYRLRALGLIVTTRGDSIAVAPESVSVDFATLLTLEPMREVYLGFSRFDVLADYAPTFSALFARWVEEFRERLGVKLRNGLVTCIADARARGRYRDVSQLAKHCLSLDPLNEEATLGLAEATVLAGNKVAALQMLDAYQSDLGAASGLRLQPDLLRRRIAERLNVYAAQPHDVPMLGREDALEYLLRGVHELSSGTARSLLVTGEAGVGKTRLLTEFAKITAMHSVRTVTLRCHPGWREQPLRAITDLVTTLLQLPGALGASPDAMATLRDLTSALPRRSDVGIDAGDAEAILANLRWSVLDLFEAVMQEKKLVLLVDNVQWLDELSEHFLDYVLGRCAERPLYLVMTSREGPEAEEREVKRPLLATEHRLVLRPLDDVTARALVRQVVELTDRKLSEASVDSCVRRCGGNPYFLSELARFYLVSGPDAVPPVSLRMFIEYRLGKVSASARRTLEVVAILGSFATLRRIRRVLQVRSVALLNTLEELQAADLVRAHGDCCECRHDIVRELVEAGMSMVARRTLHLRSARELHREAAASGDAGLLFQCGRHLLRSGDTVRAPRGALMLAKRLLELGVADSACQLAAVAAEQAMDVGMRARANVLMVRSFRAQGDWVKVSALCKSLASAAVSELSDTFRTELDIYSAEAAIQLAPFDRSQVNRLVGIATNPHLGWSLRLLASRLTISVADNKWDRELQALIAPTIESAPEFRGPTGVLSAISKVILATMKGQHALARMYAERLNGLRREVGSLALQHRCTRIAAHCYFRLGDIDRAKALFEDSLVRSDSAGRHYIAVYDHAFLALIDLQNGEVGPAKAHLQLARERSEQIGLQTDISVALQILQLEACVEDGELPAVPRAEYRRLRPLALDLDPRMYQSLLAVQLLQNTGRTTGANEDPIRRELHAAVQRFCGCGWQDFPMYALAYSYFHAGDAQTARAIVGRYLASERAERGKLRPHLEQLAATLGLSWTGSNRIAGQVS